VLSPQLRESADGASGEEVSLRVRIQLAVTAMASKAMTTAREVPVGIL
jgi:hypothetical protein